MPTLMRRKLNPHISYKFDNNNMVYSTDKKNWFLFLGCFTVEDIMAEDWEIYNITK